MNRRDALKLTAATTAGLMLARLSEAQSTVKPLRVLVFGGTGFIGPHIVELLRAQGHKLTLLNRGKRNPTLFPDIETLIGDRNGQLDALKGRDWDVAIDNSGYTPKQVKLSTDLLKGHVQQYVFVSSISVYRDLTPPGIDEDYPVATLSDPTVEEITDATYGALKALCEKNAEDSFGNNATILRPSYIVGPGDTSDRFTYWPVRTSKGGEMLAPGSPSDPIQFIDVRDLAQFVRGCVERRIGGRFNLCNPAGAVRIGDVLDISKRITGANTKFVWAPTEFLEKHKAIESGEVTIWAPPVGEYAGATLISSARAVAKGLTFSSPETTIRDTLAWHKTRPADKQKLRAGLTPERETELLRLLAGR